MYGIQFKRMTCIYTKLIKKTIHMKLSYVSNHIQILVLISLINIRFGSNFMQVINQREKRGYHEKSVKCVKVRSFATLRVMLQVLKSNK